MHISHLMLYISIVLTVSAQTLLKIASSGIQAESQGLVGIVFSYLKSPLILTGFALYSLAALMFTYSLSKLDLSYATFVASLSYILIIFVSLFILKEVITPIRWAGCGFVMLGVLLIIRS